MTPYNCHPRPRRRSRLPIGDLDMSDARPHKILDPVRAIILWMRQRDANGMTVPILSFAQ